MYPYPTGLHVPVPFRITCTRTLQKYIFYLNANFFVLFYFHVILWIPDQHQEIDPEDSDPDLYQTEGVSYQDPILVLDPRIRSRINII